MITVRYSSIDGARKAKRTTDIAKARAFAVQWVGEHPDFGTSYAVSFDGVGKITVEGAALAELFGVEADKGGTWFRLSQDGFDAGGPYESLQTAQGWAWAAFEEGRGVFAVEEWTGEEFVRCHPIHAPHFGPELPEGAYGVRQIAPLHCAITDGLIGSTATLVLVAQTEAEAVKAADLRNDRLHECSDDYYEVARFDGRYWRAVNLPRPLVDTWDQDVPF